MNALVDLFALADADDALSTVPLFPIEPRDRRPEGELARQAEVIALTKKQCRGVHIVAVPNAANRGQKALNQAVKEGAAWGFPDLVVLAPGRVAFVEMKNGTKGPEHHQTDWLNRLHLMGYPCGVFRSAEAVLAFLGENGFPVRGVSL